jgi:autotransporter-associated beta strand protein
LNSSLVVTTTVATDSVTLSGNINGVGGLSAGGPGTTVIGGTNTYGGSTAVTGGTLSVTAHAALPAGTAVSIASGSQLVLAAGAGDPTIGTLALASGGGLNVNNNRMFLTDSAGEPAALIADLKIGFASGWAGPTGIFSTTAAHTAGYGVAFGEGSVFSRIPAGEIELSYALNGDINQDGAVNGTDFGILASNFGKNVTGGWEQGDFTYAGKVNATDFGLLAANFGKTATGVAIALPASDWQALDAFATANGLTSALPEPASFGLLGVVGVGILNRRRRK